MQGGSRASTPSFVLHNAHLGRVISAGSRALIGRRGNREDYDLLSPAGGGFPTMKLSPPVGLHRV